MHELGEWAANDVKYPDRWPSAKDQIPYLIWRSQFCQGRPKATEYYTVEKLEAMGMVGLYWPAEKEAPK